MNDKDIFHQLQSGVRFSRRSNEKKNKIQSSERKSSEIQPPTTTRSARSLDFFGTKRKQGNASDLEVLLNFLFILLTRSTKR